MVHLTSDFKKFWLSEHCVTLLFVKRCIANAGISNYLLSDPLKIFSIFYTRFKLWDSIDVHVVREVNSMGQNEDKYDNDATVYSSDICMYIELIRFHLINN